MTAATNGAGIRRANAGPDLATLCHSVVQLAKDLPTPVQRLSLHVGEWAVDVEFAPATPSAASAPITNVQLGSPEPTVEIVDSATIVRSELVGTFFAAPSPGADPFVRVGDEVVQGEQLGIVEAMKLMNPVLAPCDGKVVREHVCDGEQVEYDQPLISLELTVQT